MHTKRGSSRDGKSQPRSITASWLLTLVVAMPCAVGCGGDSNAASESDAEVSEAEHDAGAVRGNGMETLNGCAPQDYVDMSAADATRVVAIAAAGLTFTPRCMMIAAGQSVRWEGSLTAHPLAPGNPDSAQAGSPDNPIVETSTGRSAEFTFSDAGTYPYYCTLHAFGAGQGMAGSIHVQ